MYESLLVLPSNISRESQFLWLNFVYNEVYQRIFKFPIFRLKCNVDNDSFQLTRIKSSSIKPYPERVQTGVVRFPEHPFFSWGKIHTDRGKPFNSWNSAKC